MVSWDFLVEGGLDFLIEFGEEGGGDLVEAFVEGVELLEELLAEVAGFGGAAGGGEGDGDLADEGIGGRWDQ